MTSWRDRLCGSEAVTHSNNDADATLHQNLNTSNSLSCGGGHYPADLCTPNMKTFHGTFLLPTTEYAVLLFRDDGSAIIYSDAENYAAEDAVDDSQAQSIS